jgi:hypothetical protein
VVETAVRILKLDPENAKAADFKSKSEQEMARQQRLKELVSQAKRADKERDYEACLRAAEEGLALDSGPCRASAVAEPVPGRCSNRSAA